MFSSRSRLPWLCAVLVVSAPAAMADPHPGYNPVYPGYHPGGLQPWAHPGGLHPWYARYHEMPDWFAHRDSVTLQAGDAVAANKAMQMVDPWPPYVQNRHIPFHGEVIDGAIDRYKADEVKDPAPAVVTLEEE